MLPGYVPKRGQYNETYLEVIKSIVAKASKFGIYTLLDMHQDVMSPKFCVEGFPDWAVNTGYLISILIQIHCFCTESVLLHCHNKPLAFGLFDSIIT